jgi:hypothetical protein
LAGRYDNLILTQFLAPIECLKIPALLTNSFLSIYAALLSQEDIYQIQISCGIESGLYTELKYLKKIYKSIYGEQQARPEAEFLDEIQTKIIRDFLHAIHSHLYSFALSFPFLQTHAASYSFCSSTAVHCKGERSTVLRRNDTVKKLRSLNLLFSCLFHIGRKTVHVGAEKIITLY